MGSLTEDQSAHGQEGNNKENESKFHLELKRRKWLKSYFKAGSYIFFIFYQRVHFINMDIDSKLI